MGDSFLSLSGVSKSYGAFAALQATDINVDEGEFVTLLGASGCGKTTTLRLIAGFQDPTSGTINVNGRVLSTPQGSVPPENRNMAMMFQSYAIWPHMTVFENVAFPLRARKQTENLQARVTSALETVQMAAYAGRRPHELSGGQQQRVGLARCLVSDPTILLMDEPLSNLDAALRIVIRSDIRKLHKASGRTTIYVTHDHAEAMVLSDRLIVMDKGRVLQTGTPIDVYAKPVSKFVAEFFGEVNWLPEQLVSQMCSLDGPMPSGRLFGLRPASITLTLSTEDGGGVVTDVVYHGELTEYSVKLADADQVVSVRSPTNVDIILGSQVRLSASRSSIIAIDS